SRARRGAPSDRAARAASGPPSHVAAVPPRHRSAGRAPYRAATAQRRWRTRCAALHPPPHETPAAPAASRRPPVPCALRPPHAAGLPRFADAAVRANPATTEVSPPGPRLPRIPRQLRLRAPDLALVAAGHAIPDWRGGPRLGEALRAFLDLWGQRGTARRAV